jgi:hypothetical protein
VLENNASAAVGAGAIIRNTSLQLVIVRLHASVAASGDEGLAGRRTADVTQASRDRTIPLFCLYDLRQNGD